MDPLVSIQLMAQGVQQRFRKAMANYCNGTLEQVDRESRQKLPSIEEGIATRRHSVGVTPIFALVEYEGPLFAGRPQPIDSF